MNASHHLIVRHGDPLTLPNQVRLPNELWLKILFTLNCNITLWLKCRRVCKLFKSWIEHYFAKHVMPKAVVQYNTTKPIRLVFAGISESGNVAILKDENTLGHYQVTNRQIAMQWQRIMTEHSGGRATRLRTPRPKFDKPGYVIFLGDAINDTELHLQYADLKRRSIEIRWKSMLTKLYREELALAHQRHFQLNGIVQKKDMFPNTLVIWRDRTNEIATLLRPPESLTMQDPSEALIAVDSCIHSTAYDLLHAVRLSCRNLRVRRQADQYWRRTGVKVSVPDEEDSRVEYLDAAIAEMHRNGIPTEPDEVLEWDRMIDGVREARYRMTEIVNRPPYLVRQTTRPTLRMVRDKHKLLRKHYAKQRAAANGGRMDIDEPAEWWKPSV